MVENHSYRWTARELPTGRLRRGLITYFTQSHETTADRSVVGHLTINILPDELLLEIFDFYVWRAANRER